MKIYDTTLPQNYSKGLFEEKNYDLAPEHLDKMFYTLFTATSNLLNNVKKQDKPAAFVFERIDGTVVAAAIVQFFANEDASKPGNWNLVWTFDESDIPENSLKISLNDVQTHTYFKSIAGEKWGMTFKDPACLVTCLTYALEQLRKWLDENATENEEIMIEQESVFQARVAVENGEKVFAIEPAGEIKMLIKDDSAIEK